VTQRIFRYEVPVDDKWHDFELFGDPLAVGARRLDTVEFWALNAGPTLVQQRSFMVVGTGQELPDNYQRHWGTAIAGNGALVWHLLERVR